MHKEIKWRQDMVNGLASFFEEFAHSTGKKLAKLQLEAFEDGYKLVLTQETGSFDMVAFIPADSIESCFDIVFSGYLDTRQPAVRFIPSRYTRKGGSVWGLEGRKSVK